MALTPDQQAELNDLLSEYNNLQDDTNASAAEHQEMAEKLGNLTRQEIEHLKQQATIRDAMIGALDNILALQQGIGRSIQDQIKDTATYLDQLQKMQGFKEKAELMANAERQLGRDLVRQAEEKLKLAKQSQNPQAIKDSVEELANAKKQKKMLDESAKSMDRMDATLNKDLVPGMSDFKSFGMDLVSAYKEGGPFKVALFVLRKSLDVAKQIAGMFTKNFADGMNFTLMGILDKMITMGFELDKVTKQFERATQLGNDFSDSMVTTAEETAKFGVSMEEASKAHMEMIKNSTEFTLATRAQRDAVAKTAAVMGELGVATSDFATGIQNSMKFFGESMMQAEETQRELLAVAKELRVIPGELSSAFAKLGPRMAKFGQQGIDTFKELARVSKITGMEMEKILNLTDQFDTFEGAAEQVGKINAALGGNFVNAMEMMTATDPAERFNMMRDALSSAGLSFDSMSYYQKKFFAESMGLSSVGDLALMMSGNMDSLGGATQKSAEEYAEMARQAQIVQSVQEKFNAVIATFFMENKDQIMAIIDGLGNFLQALLDNTENIKTFIKFIGYASLAFTALGIATGITTAIMAKNALAAVGLGQAIKVTTFASALMARKNIFLAATQVLFSTALKGTTLAATALRFALIGLALFGIGALVMALMIESPSKLVVALFALGAALGALASASPALTAKIAPLSVAMKALGAGVLMAAGAIALLFLAMAEMSPEQMIGVPIILAGFAKFGAPAGAGLTALAGGIKALGLVVATGVGFAGLLALVAIITAIGYAVGQAVPLLIGLMEVILTMSGDELKSASMGLLFFSGAIAILFTTLRLLGKGAAGAAKGIAIVLAVLFALSIIIAIIALSLAEMTNGFAAMFDTLSGEKMKVFTTFLATLVTAVPIMLGASAGLTALSAGITALGTGLGFVNENKLASLGNFILGLSEITGGNIGTITAELLTLSEALEMMGENEDLVSPFTSLNTAISTLDENKVEGISTMLAAVTALETTGLERLAEAFEQIAESIDKIPSNKAVALTATMRSATVTAKAIQVLQGRGGGAAAAGGAGGRGSGGGGVSTTGDVKREFKVDFVLDSEIFEEHVITIIDENVGKKTLEAIRNER
jgi:hypothetical protein